MGPLLALFYQHWEAYSGLNANRPLAGTRRRGQTPEDDEALEKELLADAKECSEHVMLVDLGRNDVGKVRHKGSFFYSGEHHHMPFEQGGVAKAYM